jgi:hypothetical protein
VGASSVTLSRAPSVIVFHAAEDDSADDRKDYREHEEQEDLERYFGIVTAFDAG